MKEATDHSTDRHRRIAEEGLILRSVVGSTAFGTGVGNSDVDIMGVCIEPPDCVIGLNSFEQYKSRSVPEGLRSGPGDTDMTIYSLRKFMRLALKGNPSILELLFVRYEIGRGPGIDLIFDGPEMVASKQAGHCFLGYMEAQRQRLTGEIGHGHGKRGGGQREELIEEFGFDVKFASHMCRLGFEGVEYLETGRLILPLPLHQREWLQQMRLGEVSLENALKAAGVLEARLKELLTTSELPDKPDYEKANAWLIEAYQRAWSMM